MTRILVVDDDPCLREVLSCRLEASGYEVTASDSAEAALTEIAFARPDLVITDLCMSGVDGMALVEAVQTGDPTLPVIVLTGYGTINDAVTATRRGVFAFLTKPYDVATLLEEIRTALTISTPVLPADEQTDNAWREDILTRSPVMDEVLRRAKLIAATDVRVCLQGPSGSGKELLARAIHRASPRAKSAFVAVNCAALPEHLLESELFGHTKGAFTGATRDHKGLFQAANNGTLFLDEIGDMPLPLQAKLLRVLEEQSVRPIGSLQEVPVDVRVISATHRDLDVETEAGRFRHDLRYRLSGAALVLPSLSERREDIALLATHFLKRFAMRHAAPASTFAPDALELLVTAPWPGNVRQLANVVEQAVALCPTPIIPRAWIQQALGAEPRDYPSLDAATSRFEHEYLMQLLRITDGNVTRAATLAGRNRTNFYKLLRRHRIDTSLLERLRA